MALVYNLNNSATQVLAAKQIKENIFVDLLHRDGKGVTEYQETNATTIRGLCEVLDNMVKHKFKAHQYISLFYNNYTSVSALVYSMMEMGLDLDYIEIAAPDTEFVDPSASWWAKTSYSVQRFLSSFSVKDTNSRQ